MNGVHPVLAFTTEVGGACEDARGQGGGNEMNEDSCFGISLDAFVGVFLFLA